MEVVVIAVGAASLTAQMFTFLILNESRSDSAAVELAESLFAMIKHSIHPRVIPTADNEPLALYRIVLLIIG